MLDANVSLFLSSKINRASSFVPVILIFKFLNEIKQIYWTMQFDSGQMPQLKWICQVVEKQKMQCFQQKVLLLLRRNISLDIFRQINLGLSGIGCHKSSFSFNKQKKLPPYVGHKLGGRENCLLLGFSLIRFFKHEKKVRSSIPGCGLGGC